MKHDERLPTIKALEVKAHALAAKHDRMLDRMYEETVGQLHASALSGMPGKGAGGKLEVDDDDGMDWVPLTGVEASVLGELFTKEGKPRPDPAAAALARFDAAIEKAADGLRVAMAIAADWQPVELTPAARQVLGKYAKPGDPICDPCNAQGHVALSFTKEPSDVKGNLTVPLLLCEWHWRHVRDNGQLPTRAKTAERIASTRVKAHQ